MPYRFDSIFQGQRLPNYTGSGAQAFPVLDPGSELLAEYTSPNLFSNMVNYGRANALAYSVSGGQLTPNTSGLGLKVYGTPEQFGFGLPNTAGSGSWGDFFRNYGGTLLGAAQGIGNLFMGMKQYGLAKDALKESRRQFQLNYDAQRKLTNARLGDRQDARRAADPERHMTREEYLAKYGV